VAAVPYIQRSVVSSPTPHFRGAGPSQLTPPPSSPSLTPDDDAAAATEAASLFLNIGLQNGVLLRTEVDRVTGQLSDTRTRFLGARAPKLFATMVRPRPSPSAMRMVRFGRRGLRGGTPRPPNPSNTRVMRIHVQTCGRCPSFKVHFLSPPCQTKSSDSHLSHRCTPQICSPQVVSLVVHTPW
jgi:hypothetical protein